MHCGVIFFKDLGESYVSNDIYDYAICYAIIFVLLMFVDTFIFTNAWKYTGNQKRV